jgi:hypothetical protein
MASTVPPIKIAKVKAGKARATVAGQNVAKGQSIQRRDSTFWNDSIRSLRDSGRPIEAIRTMARVDGTVSSAMFSLVQVAGSSFTVKAYDPATNEFSLEGTQLAAAVMASLDTLYDYTEGFADKQSVDGLVQMMLREVAITDACCAELVLDKAGMPNRIAIFGYETMTWVHRGDGTRFPKQQSSSGADVELDFPTIAIGENARDANSAYTRSMFEAALTMAFYFGEFIEDMRRVLRKAGHSRTLVKIILEKVQQTAPEDAKTDPLKMAAYLESVRTEVEQVIKDTEPEDALVFYDTAEVNVEHADGDKSDYTQLMTALSGMLATSLKSSPSILGLRIAGSQSLSNTESLLFLKTARYIQIPVETVLSRLLTLAVRLMGTDVYVNFKFDPINLRPEDELEAFRSMRQSRILELLSTGFISDDEAAAMLGTGPRPPGAPPLSGTMFLQPAKIDASKASPNNGAQEKAMTSDQPTGQRGSNKK